MSNLIMSISAVFILSETEKDNHKLCFKAERLPSGRKERTKSSGGGLGYLSGNIEGVNNYPSNFI